MGKLYVQIASRNKQWRSNMPGQQYNLEFNQAETFNSKPLTDKCKNDREDHRKHKTLLFVFHLDICIFLSLINYCYDIWISSIWSSIHTQLTKHLFYWIFSMCLLNYCLNNRAVWAWSSSSTDLVSAMAHHSGYPALGSISCWEASLDGGRPVVNDHVVPNHPQLLRVRLLLALVLHCLVLILNAILLAWV